MRLIGIQACFSSNTLGAEFGSMRSRSQYSSQSGVSTKMTAEESTISSDEDNTSEDDAPESVSFGKSRQDALESISLALKETRRLKELKKEKRRKRHALLKEQRQSKIDLSSARLPDSLLKEISAQGDADSHDKDVSEDAPVTREADEPGSSDEDGDEGLEDDEEEEEEDSGLEGLIDRLDDDINSDDEETSTKQEDFLPFEGFQAIPLSETKHRVPSAKESALEFMNKHLYGGRIHRTSVNKHVSSLLKKQHKPALHFTKQDKKKLKKRKKQLKKVKKGKNWGALLAE